MEDVSASNGVLKIVSSDMPILTGILKTILRTLKAAVEFWNGV